MPSGFVESALWRTYFHAEAADTRTLFTSYGHAFERAVAALEHVCTNVVGGERGRLRGDWPRRRPAIRLEVRLSELAPGQVGVAISAHPAGLTLFPARRCRHAVRQLVRALIYD